MSSSNVFSNISTLPTSISQPTTPSKRREASSTPHTPSTARRDHSQSIRNPPLTPSRPTTLLSTAQAPRRRKANISHRLRGIKTTLPPDLSIARDHSQSIRNPPLTPSRPTTLLSTAQAPRRRKANISHRLRGIKTTLPPDLSIALITLISKLQLPYTPDEWQVHLIRRILQGYDSIF
ncbi:hypothetical protein CVT26_002468 [Gymnopilus dilepis]|uniref:Uncharacterized protein n=1 Tax=Gymnopilus dilepis TaxID=231916 RepID=A0A409YX26_9AGAR|nr:hypothetical protein CVT26_002468 [Gymnopilus dilepis]